MARKIFQPPTPLPLPDKLPFEDEIDLALDRAAHAIQRSALAKRLRQFEERLPIVDSVGFPTPLGKVQTPRLQLPSFSPPEMDDRKKEVVKAAVADDLAGLVEKIPVVGTFAGIITDAIEDTYMAKLQDLLTPEEWARFREYDKVSPITTIAALRTFVQQS